MLGCRREKEGGEGGKGGTAAVVSIAGAATASLSDGNSASGPSRTSAEWRVTSLADRMMVMRPFILQLCVWSHANCKLGCASACASLRERAAHTFGVTRTWLDPKQAREIGSVHILRSARICDCVIAPPRRAHKDCAACLRGTNKRGL